MLLNKELYKIFESYNKIEDSDDIGRIDFVELHYKSLIDNETKVISDIEDISTIFKDYFVTLAELGHYSEVIKRREKVKEFVEQLNGKSKKYDRYLIEIEFVYAEALTSTQSKYKEAVQVLEKIQKLDPKNENIWISIKYAKLNNRRKLYFWIIITGLSIVFIGLILSIINDDWVLSQYELIGMGIFIFGVIMQYGDGYLTERKSPNH